MIWEFPGGGYCCPQCGVPFTRLGDHVAEQRDWQVTVRLVAHCRPGPDTCCFVMDPSRAGAVLARRAGIGQDTGQLTADQDGGPRQLVISSDFYCVYTSAGRKADGLVNLYCWAHIRRYFVRAGDADPAQLTYWAQARLGRIKALYAAHEQLMTAWAEAAAPASAAEAAARLQEAGTAWDAALGVIDAARQQQTAAPGLAGPAKKALATLDREWDGLAAHRAYPMVSLDNYPDAAVMPMSAGSGVPAAGQGGALAV